MDITNTVNTINPMNNTDTLDQLNQLIINELSYYHESIVYNESTKIEQVEELDNEDLNQIIQYYLEQDKIEEENARILAEQHHFQTTHCCICMCDIIQYSTVCSKNCDDELRQMLYDFPLSGFW